MAASTESVREKLEIPQEEKEELEMPDEFKCSLSLAVMKDPVTTADGHAYEREDIEEWLITRGNRTSPLTGATLEHTILTPNTSLREAIEVYKSKMSEVKQMEIERRRENLNLQEIIKLRETEIAKRCAKRDFKKEGLIVEIRRLYQMLIIETNERIRAEDALKACVEVPEEVMTNITRLTKRTEILQREVQPCIERLARETEALRLALAESARLASAHIPTQPVLAANVATAAASVAASYNDSAAPAAYRSAAALPKSKGRPKRPVDDGAAAAAGGPYTPLAATSAAASYNDSAAPAAYKSAAASPKRKSKPGKANQ